MKTFLMLARPNHNFVLGFLLGLTAQELFGKGKTNAELYSIPTPEETAS